MNRQEIIRQLSVEYQQLRADKAGERDERLELAIKTEPRIGELRERMSRLFFKASQAVLSGASGLAMPDYRADAAKITREIAKLLKKHDLPENYLDIIPECPICGDTGQVGEPLREWCACFKQKLLARAYAASNLMEFENENFEKFDITRFPDNVPLPGEVITQRGAMVKIRNQCERYARDFPDTAVLNILLLGSSGLGKSFLLNCVTAAVLDRGNTALKLTAFSMLSQMRAWHMGKGNMDDLMNVELLAIDDLGTEPMIENVSIEYLFTLLNERLTAKRHTVIATNLSPKELLERYTERVTSRLFQKRTTLMLPFVGKDIRII